MASLYRDFRFRSLCTHSPLDKRTRPCAFSDRLLLYATPMRRTDVRCGLVLVSNSQSTCSHRRFIRGSNVTIFPRDQSRLPRWQNPTLRAGQTDRSGLGETDLIRYGTGRSGRELRNASPRSLLTHGPLARGSRHGSPPFLLGRSSIAHA